MGARGPAKLPAALRLVTGASPGHDVAGRPVETVPFERIELVPPKWLTGWGREIWVLTAPTLLSLKITKAEDIAAFAAYCEACSEFHAAVLDIADRGMILESMKSGRRFIAVGDPEYSTEDPDWYATGYFVPAPEIERKANPSVAIKNNAAARIRAFAREFGLTPSAEAAIASLGKESSAPRGDASPFAGLG